MLILFLPLDLELELFLPLEIPVIFDLFVAAGVAFKECKRDFDLELGTKSSSESESSSATSAQREVIEEEYEEEYKEEERRWRQARQASPAVVLAKFDSHRPIINVPVPCDLGRQATHGKVKVHPAVTHKSSGCVSQS
jgi:hypothetical protein